MPTVESPKINIESLSQADRAELSRQLAEAQRKSSLETGVKVENVKATPNLAPVKKGAGSSEETDIKADLKPVASGTPNVETTAQNQPAENLGDLLTLVQEGRLISNSGESLTDLNAFMANLNARLAIPKPGELDLKKRMN